MENIIQVIFFIALLYVVYKIFIALWIHVIVPTGKFAWKWTIILATLTFFVILFVFREAILDILPIWIELLVISVGAIIAGVKFLKRKGRM